MSPSSVTREGEGVAPYDNKIVHVGGNGPRVMLNMENLTCNL